MANVLVSDSSLSSIADAIREKSGSSNTYKPGEMANAILAIPTGGSSTPYGEHIYGVTWGSSADPAVIDTVGQRTDEAKGFTNPVPFLAGSIEEEYMMSLASCGSPFDGLYPWSEMRIIKDKAGDFVSIPKFWYRWANSDAEYGLSLQIATYAAPGFSLAPAFRDRSDGKGERDMVYISRYKSTVNNGMSTTGYAPLVNMTRAQLRTTISTQMAQIGLFGYSIQDYAMFWTVRMLYLVEYANWDSQSAIGFNAGKVDNGQNDPLPTGTTDTMPYHTGSMRSSRSAYGQGVQYRYIEDPWGGAMEWVDGWYMDSGRNISIILDPAKYSDTEGGVTVGNAPSYGRISSWEIPKVAGYDWALTPVVTDGGGSDLGVADYCHLGGPALYCGGDLGADAYYGAFCLGAYDASNLDASIGARLQKIP